MRIYQRIENSLLVCHSEVPYLLWLSVLNLFLSSGAVLAFAVINALLLIRFGFKALPSSFILSSVLLSIYFVIYSYLQKRLSPKKLLIGSFILYGVILLLFGIFIQKDPNNYILLLGLYVVSISILILVDYQYWYFASTTFHPRQAKRLFPLLGMGGNIGAIIMGFSLKGLTKIFHGASNLIFLWAFMFFASAIFMYIMHRHLSTNSNPSSSQNSLMSSMIEDINSLKKLPIVRIIAVIIFIITMISFILYFQFYRLVEISFSAEDSFLGFVGYFNGFLNLAILLVQGIITSRIISLLGVVNTLFVYPVLLFIPVIVSALGSSFSPFIYTARFIDILCKKTIFQASIESIYVAIPEKYRSQAMGIIKFVVTPLSIGFAGISLHILAKFHPHLTYTLVTTLLPFLFIFWIFSIWYLREIYLETLFENFQSTVSKNAAKGTIKIDIISRLSETELRRLFLRIFEKGSKKMVKFALKLCSHIKYRSVKDEVINFLKSQDLDIRQDAIQTFGEIGGKDTFPTLMKIYPHQDDETKILILQTLRKKEPSAFHINAPILVKEEKSPVVQSFLLEAISSNRKLTPTEEEIFKSLLPLKEHRIKISVIKIIKNTKNYTYLWNIISMLQDESKEVIKEAIIAAGEMKLEEAILHLVKHIESQNREIRDLATNALIKIGGITAQTIMDSLTLKEPEDLLKRKLKIIANTGVARYRENLISLGYKVPVEINSFLIEEIVKSMTHLEDLTVQEREIVTKLLQINIEDAYTDIASLQYLNNLKSDKPKEPYDILKLLLKSRMYHRKRIILYYLHILLPHEKILTLTKNIFSHNERLKSIAIEVLENTIPVSYKNKIMPLFSSDIMEELINFVPPQHTFSDLDPIIDYFITKGNSWLKGWAYLCIGFFKIPKQEEIKKATQSEDPIISEHAQRAMEMLKTPS